jgi:hypothetical protein
MKCLVGREDSGTIGAIYLASHCRAVPLIGCSASGSAPEDRNVGGQSCFRFFSVQLRARRLNLFR